MANEKNLNTRVIQKHDTDTNWNKAVNFIPKKGEIIIYETSHRIKIGDGTTKIGNLPFEKVSWKDITNKPETFIPSSHTHSKDQVGLSNVDNTADSQKSVKYAATAGSTPIIKDKKDGRDLQIDYSSPEAMPLYLASWTSSGVLGTSTPSQVKTKLGLAEVDNTADKNKSVKHASTASALVWGTW